MDGRRGREHGRTKACTGAAVCASPEIKAHWPPPSDARRSVLRSHMPRRHVKCTKSNEQPFRLIPAKKGTHQFGGACGFSGLAPKNSDVPIQQVLLIDLRDSDIPLATEPQIDFLPLLYPFKYGGGGPEIQYSIVSETQVEILYLSDPEPDDPEWQYLQVAELPQQPLALKALTYQEARCLTFMREDGFFQPNRADLKILNKLDVNNLIKLGGRRNHISNAPIIQCHNPKCDQHNKETVFQFVAMVPPIPVSGEDDFWYEFQGAHVDFCFGLCYYCGTIIAFNGAG